MQPRMQSPLLVALDHHNLDQVMAFVDEIDPHHCKLKVGNILFTHCGPKLVTKLHQRGFKVFLDLKFHDIPNTVANSVAAAAELGVWMLSLHASGGARMMDAAREALLPYRKESPLLMAVTVLTSMEQRDLADIGIKTSPVEYAERLALLAKERGMHGVICSPQEVHRFRNSLGREFVLVTPGIRPEGYPSDDQRRVMSPKDAQRAGVDYMVIGRPITGAAEPVTVLQQILLSLATELKNE